MGVYEISNIRVECSWDFFINLTNILVHRSGFLNKRVRYTINPKMIKIFNRTVGTVIKNFWDLKKENTPYLSWKIETNQRLKKFNGAKFFSPSLSLSNFLLVTPKILNTIELTSYITRKCIFRIQMFTDTEQINALKFLTLIDPDTVKRYFNHVKYHENILRLIKKAINVDSNIQLEQLVSEAEFILNNRLQDMVNKYINMYTLNGSITEIFRFAGNYIKKWPEIKNKIVLHSHLFNAALDPKYKREDYHSKLLTIIKEVAADISVE